MTRQLIGIYGARGHGRDVLLFLSQSCKQAIGAEFVFIDDDPAINESCGLRCMSLEAFGEDRTGHKSVAIALANPQLREVLFHRVRALDLPVSTFCADTALIYRETHIGEGSLISPGVVISPGVTIGKAVHANTQAIITHDCSIGDFVTIGPGARISGCVEVGDQALVGSGALIRQGTIDRPRRIGRGAVIGMGAVVVDDVPDGETWIGNPARPMKQK